MRIYVLAKRLMGAHLKIKALKSKAMIIKIGSLEISGNMTKQRKTFLYLKYTDF